MLELQAAYEAVTVMMIEEDLSLGYILYQKQEEYEKTTNQISCSIELSTYFFFPLRHYQDLNLQGTVKAINHWSAGSRVFPVISQDIPRGKSCLVKSNPAEDCMARSQFDRAARWRHEEYKRCWIQVSMDNKSRMVSICSTLTAQKQARLHIVSLGLRDATQKWDEARDKRKKHRVS